MQRFEIGAAPKADEEDFSYIDCDDVTDDISTTEQSSAMSQREEDTTSTKSSSTTSESPQRQRGRGRGRGRGSRSRSQISRRGSRGRGSRSRGSSRGSGSRGRAGTVRMEVDEDELLRERQTSMSEEVAAMDVGQLRDVLQQVIQKMPSVMLDIMRPARQQPGGHHPSPGSSQPDWCFCGLCREMPTEVEKVCCQKERCISLLPDFNILILDESVLALARMMRRDILVFDDEPDQRKANRHGAYRQYILWTYGRLTSGDRRVIPSCCVWKIRDKFPDAFGQYTGFIPSRLA